MTCSVIALVASVLGPPGRNYSDCETCGRTMCIPRMDGVEMSKHYDGAVSAGSSVRHG